MLLPRAFIYIPLHFHSFSSITVGLDENPHQSKTAQGSDCCSLAAYSLRGRCDTEFISEGPLVS